MNIKQRKECALVLSNLASIITNTNDFDADNYILDICTELMKLVDKKPAVDSLDDKIFKSRLNNHLEMYKVMKNFMDGAAKRVDFSDINDSLMKAETLYQSKCDEMELLQSYIKTKEEAISKKKAEIHDLLEKDNGLIKEVREKIEELEKLKKYEKEYNREKLDELKVEVERLHMDTEYLSEQYDVLTKETLDTISDLSKTLDKIGCEIEIKEIVNANNRAIEFKKAIEILCVTNEEYKSWFKGITNIVDTMEKKIGEEETQNLRGVMTKEELKKKNSLVKDIDEKLMRLTKFAESCAEAARKDYAVIVAEAKQ